MVSFTSEVVLFFSEVDEITSEVDETTLETNGVPSPTLVARFLTRVTLFNPCFLPSLPSPLL